MISTELLLPYPENRLPDIHVPLSLFADAKSMKGYSMSVTNRLNANGKSRYRPVNPRQLLLQVAHQFIGKKNERVSIAIPDIFIKMPEQKVGQP